MNIKLYQQYLVDYIRKAYAESDGSVASITEHLYGFRVGRWFVANREEKLRALTDAQHAFSEHRHWPLEIILSHLGVDIQPSS